MKEVLDRLAGGESFDKVAAETGITAKVAEATQREDGPAYLVVQEGGSSMEIYVHSSPTEEEAEEFRVSCARGAYRTSPVIEVPSELAALGETFYECVEDVLKGTLDFGYVPVPSDDDDDAG